ncbi:3-oxoadipate enol-lactonase [Epibacterium sp. SM1979]|uniref:3-oxoadipate enol-lactonase n=1 Tax=Tritonibacter litoralis TaxID=2662264 RepID=A0A843YJ55_9RHOB|nr:3-oxoadipate enol-lactonase [Tritonibacter litoralis]MQQ09838.1 3-oxoadipate enol-lactonase [Tritonibacter litoralis]
MQTAHVHGLTFHIREDGDPTGRPVVFANSLGTDMRLWDKVVSLLPAGLRVIRFDKRGHGLSDCPPAPYAMEELISDAEALLDHLQIRDCVFVGLSIGGMIAQGLAARRPDLVRALVLSNTAAKMGDAQMWRDRIAAIQIQGIEALADPILDRWFGSEFRNGEEQIIWRHMLTRTPVEGYVGCCQAIADTDLSITTTTLRLPVLGIAGSDDGASPPELVQQTIDLIPGATCHIIKSAGHLPCVEGPKAYAALLKGFLEEIAHV